MKEEKYISVSQYAKVKGITKQAVYKQLNNKLKEFLIEVDGVKYIKIEALGEVEREKLKEVEQPVEQPFNNQIQPFLEKQIEEKDKTIESLLMQIDNLQEEISRLTDLLHNSQVLLLHEKQLYIEEKKKKKGFLRIFKRKNEE